MTATVTATATPPKRPRFTPFPKVSGRFGAPMGRMDTRTDFDWGCRKEGQATRRARLCVSGPQWEYDVGGAYWGLSDTGGPVYAVWERGKGHLGVAYVRAWSKHGAISKLLGD
jgi:hypothetical protein